MKTTLQNTNKGFKKEYRQAQFLEGGLIEVDEEEGGHGNAKTNL